MPLSGKVRWLRENLPKVAYVAMTAGGMVFIWIAKTSEWDGSFTIAVCVGLMVTYFLLAAVLGAFRFHDEQAGDNLYYMGFLFTLTSLGVALYRYDAEGSVDGIVRDFGLAVVTTISGIALRILYNQVRRDPIDIERSARHELAEMTRRVRTELDAASREFANFRRVSNQMLEEGFEEIGRQAEKSGQQILKVLEALTQEAVKPVGAAGQQIRIILDDVGKQTGDQLTATVQRMDAATRNFEQANTRMADTVTAFGEKVEAAGTKLAEVKTPDEIITIKLKPTLTALGKLVDSHSNRLDASDEERGKQFEAIGQIHAAIAQLSSSVERSVSAMEKAVEVSSHSQKTTENLTGLLQQQHNDMRQHLEKLSNDQTRSLARRIVDDLSARIVNRQAAAAQPSPTSPSVEAPAAELAQQGPWGAPEVQKPEAPADRKWWPMR